MKLRRTSGILMPIASLPSSFGIGNIGMAAYEFIDFLRKAGQHFWQILPIGPTGFGNSPYQSFSTFAGNFLLIDPGLLHQDGLLTCEDISTELQVPYPSFIDYEQLAFHRLTLLHKAYRRYCIKKKEKELDDFLKEESAWLPDYALFMVLKEQLRGVSWQHFPAPLRHRESQALDEAYEKLFDSVRFYSFLQLTFFNQWQRMHKYAAENGVSLIGDLPFYPSFDSADVWSSPECFQLDDQLFPRFLAGVPPDEFSPTGQLWGNPLYNWDFCCNNDFAWWKARLKMADRLFDWVRLDHFRGIESCWAIPSNARSAQEGRWIKGPGISLIRMMHRTVPDLPLIAEDLGFLTDDVRLLLEQSGYPGMKVLQFAFDSPDSPYLPHNYPYYCVCFTGTHDNHTLRGWLECLSPEKLSSLQRYFDLNQQEGFCRGILRGGMSSPAWLFIAQLQDWLELNDSARINVPGTFSPKNWSWRLEGGWLTADLATDLHHMTERYDRL